jgi:lysyl-tRNA synthetase class 2
LSIREHGKLVFGNIEDQDGKIQLYIKSDELNPNEKEKQNLGFAQLHLLDIGDFVEVKGLITKTQRGEISVLVKDLWILTKAIRPLPDKWKGIVDKEQRFRKRYLDLTMNKETRDMFIRKSKFWQACRNFMIKNGYFEVETPVLEHKTGGADAKPFISHHNDLDIDLFMRISTELYQKRLIGGGFEKIYTLGPNFRNEGVDDEHLQEFSSLEWYWAYANYEDNMNLVKDLFRFIANEVYGKTTFTSRGHTYDLANEWELIDYAKIIQEKLNIDIFNSTEEEMLKIIKANNIDLKGVINRNRLIDNCWKIIRKEISGPAFLINEPKFMSPLAKSKPENTQLTERFHIIIAGSELGNGYSEINDPVDQLERFKEQEKARLEGDAESQMLDIDFVEMLEYGMPPTSGFGMSERIFWFFEDCNAREGTLFPLMREEIENTTKEIYPEIFK